MATSLYCGRQFFVSLFIIQFTRCSPFVAASKTGPECSHCVLLIAETGNFLRAQNLLAISRGGSQDIWQGSDASLEGMLIDDH